MAIHCPTSNLSFHVDWNVINWFNSSQLIRVDKFLIIKDTNSKTVEVISPEWTESISCSHKISLIVPVSSATIVSIYLLHRHLIFHYRLFALRSIISYMSASKISFTVCTQFAIDGLNGKDMITRSNSCMHRLICSDPQYPHWSVFCYFSLCQQFSQGTDWETLRSDFPFS